MALTQDQVNYWFAQNPNATADDVAAAVKGAGGLDANAGLADMIANRYNVGSNQVNDYYNQYTGGLPAQPTGAPVSNITTDYTKPSNAPTSGAVSNVVEGDDIFKQIKQLPQEISHWARSADQRTMELIDDKTGQVLDRRAVGDFSDVDLVKMGLSMVPGAGQVLGAVSALDAARKGDLVGAAIGATGLVPGLSNVNTALRVGQAVDSGNTLGALTALAGNTDVQNLVGANNVNIGGYTTNDAVKVANLTTAAQNGQWGQVIATAGDLAKSSDTTLAGKALAVLQAAQSGNSINALNMAVSAFGGTTPSSTKTSSLSDVGANAYAQSKAAGASDEEALAAANLASGEKPSGLQLAGLTNGTASDAGNGYTLGGVDAKTQSTLDALKDIDKLVATGATTAPSWVTLAKDETISGTRFQSDGSQVYTIERVNPNNPDEKVYYDVVKDPETGEVYYKQGGVSFDDEGNVNPTGYERITSSKPSWSWELKDDQTVGSDNQSTTLDSGLSTVDATDGKKGASGTLTTIANGDNGTSGDGTKGSDGTEGNGTKGTTNTGGLGTNGSTTGGGEGTTGETTGGGGGTGSGGTGTDGTGGGGGTGGDGTGGGGTGGGGTGGGDGGGDGGGTLTCPDGFHLSADGKSCVPNDKKTTLDCPEGYEPNADGTACVLKKKKLDCPEGYEPNADGTACVLIKKKVDTHECGTGYHWDEATQSCVKDTVVTPPVVTPPPVVKTPTSTFSAGPAATGGKGKPTEFLKEQLLKTYMTKDSFKDPLAQFNKARQELSKEDMMQQGVDPRLAAILAAKMNGEEPPPKKTYSYGEEPQSIDDILGLRTEGEQNFAQGGYVQPLMAQGGMALPLLAAKGGLPAMHKGREDFRDGKHVAGEGDGQSDDIPAMLADGEFVFPADVVSALGNGSTKAGTDKLYEMMHSIRDRARSKGPKDLPPPALKSPLDYLKKR